MKHKKKYELGGIVNAEVEGGEVIASPRGSMEVQGPSHAQGGVDMLLPEGAFVFSDELKGPDGKTMAERQKQREKRLKEQVKKLEDSPLDQIDKFSLQRTFANIVKEAEEDLMYQAVKSYEEEYLGGERLKLQYGTGPGGVPGQYGPMADDGTLLGLLKAGAASAPFNVAAGAMRGAQAATIGSAAGAAGAATNLGASAQSGGSQGAGGGLGLGALLPGLGPAGVALGILGPLATTIANRLGDTDNPNYFQNYGRDALAENQRSMQSAEGARQMQEAAAASQANTERRAARGAARDSATSLALSAGAGARQQAGNAQAAQQYFGNLSNVLGERARLQNEQDRMVMQGAAQADIAGRQDRDQFFTNLSSNLSNASTGMMFAQRMKNMLPTNNVDLVSLLGLDYIQ